MTTAQSTKNLIGSRARFFIGIAILAVIGFWLLTPATITYLLGYTKARDAGTFGDQFGSVNSLFTGLAFVGLVITLLLQRRDLQVSHVELQNSNKQLGLQVDALKKQNFEATFFRMVGLHHQIVNSIQYGDHTGRTSFSYLYQAYLGMRNGQNVVVPNNENELSQAYQVFYDSTESHIGHYFRNLYHIIKFVDESEQDIATKKMYCAIVRAQLSSFELRLLFYNCISEAGLGFKQLVKDYALLRNLRREKLCNPRDYSFENWDRAFGIGQDAPQE